jgi:hypothetical protein
MRYRDTAVQIYDVPTTSVDLGARSSTRGPWIIASAIATLGLVGIIGFVIFGIMSQSPTFALPWRSP